MKKLFFITMPIMLITSALCSLAQDNNASLKPQNTDYTSSAPNTVLSFKLMRDNSAEHEFSITTSGSYNSRRMMEKNNMANWVEISGEIVPAKESGKIILRVTITAHYEEENNSGEFSANSVISLTPGKETEIARFANRLFIVSAKIADEGL